MKNVEKHLEKSIPNCGTLSYIKNDIFAERYDKSNDWVRFQPRMLLRFWRFIIMVVSMIAYIFVTTMNVFIKFNY